MYKDTHTHTNSQKNWSKKWYIRLLFPWCQFSLGNLEVSLWFKKLFYFYPGCSMSCNELTLNKYHFSSCVLQSFLSFLCAVIWNFARLFTSSFVLSCFSCKPSFLPNVIGGFLFTHYFLPLLKNIGEGNGNLLQYSCLENPMDGGAW